MWAEEIQNILVFVDTFCEVFFLRVTCMKFSFQDKLLLVFNFYLKNNYLRLKKCYLSDSYLEKIDNV